MREKTIENYLVARVKSRSGLCIKFPPLFLAGFPDRIVLLPGGRFYLVELKSPTGVLSKVQMRFHSVLQDLGFTVHVLNSKEQIDKWLNSCTIQ